REAARADIRGFFLDVMGCEEIDLSRDDHGVAELTGSLVIDHARGIGYCGLSERCDMAGARAMHDAFGLRLMFCFELAQGEYHTNVMMTSLAGRAVILAPDGFADPDVPRAIARAFEDRVIWLTPEQKRDYAGNAITLSSDRVWMSERAASALTDAQRAFLAEWGFAARFDHRRNRPRQTARESPPAKIGVGAHAAQFGVAGHVHALARHCGQPAIDADADEVAHHVGAREEGARLGELRQRQHLRRVGVAERQDCFAAGVRSDRTRGRHLHAKRGFGGTQPFWYRDLRHLQHVNVL